jgi:hypothetical protein
MVEDHQYGTLSAKKVLMEARLLAINLANELVTRTTELLRISDFCKAVERKRIAFQ